MKPISDLPFGTESELVVVVQPRLIAATNLTIASKEELKKVEDDTWQKIFNSVLKPNLLHVGSLNCHRHHSDNPGMPIGFKHCGGTLTITAQPPNSSDFSWLERLGWNKSFITCSESGCNMILGSNQKLSELQNTLLHLMLKQVYPMSNFCNYVACDQKQPDNFLTKEQLSQIQGLGMVAVAPRIFSGIINNGFFPKFQEHYNFGFMLASGMKTLYGFDGFDKWARFLFNKKMEQLEDVQKSTRSLISGPKSIRKKS